MLRAFVIAAVVSSAVAAKASEGRDWSGAYAGVHLGYVETSLSYHPDTWPVYEPDFGDLKLGVLAGYNLSFDRWVVGVEGDVSFLDATESFGPIAEFSVGTQSSLRLRVGYATGNALYYVTGGAAFAETESTWTGVQPTDDGTHGGYVVGGGVEFFVTESVRARGEYQFQSFTAEHYHFPGRLDSGEFDQHVIRAALVLGL